MMLRVGTQEVTADPREFSTGSFGWCVNQKVTLDVGGIRVTCQVTANVTVVGSKKT